MAVPNGSCNIMFLHTEIMAHPRRATYRRNGPAEHLFELINLCLLIERHGTFILAPAESGGISESRALSGNAQKLVRHTRSPKWANEVGYKFPAN